MKIKGKQTEHWTVSTYKLKGILWGYSNSEVWTINSEVQFLVPCSFVSAKTGVLPQVTGIEKKTLVGIFELLYIQRAWTGLDEVRDFTKLLILYPALALSGAGCHIVVISGTQFLHASSTLLLHDDSSCGLLQTPWTEHKTAGICLLYLEVVDIVSWSR